MDITFLSNRSSQKRGVSKNIEYILAGGHQDGFSLVNADAIDIGLAPQTHDDDKRVALEVYLGSNLYHHTMDHEMGTID